MSGSWDAYHRLFPVTSRWIYFNHAATSPYSVLTAQAMDRYIRDFEQNGGLNYQEWEGVHEEVRGLAGRLLDCKPSEVAVVSNTSEGANIVAQGLRLEAGDNILLPAKEFPANIYPWLNLHRKGVEVRFVPLRNGRLDIEEFLAHADGRTKLAAVSSVAYHNGFRLDLETLGARLHELEILFYVDAIQSLGVFPMDVKRYRISFLAADGHKWLLGPEGAGIFYCAEEGLERLNQAYASWRSVREPHRFDHISFKFAEGARRFECGTPPMAGVAGLNQSLKTLLEVGIQRIGDRVRELTGQAGDGLIKKGYNLLSPWEKGERSGIVTFTHSSRTPEDLFAILSEARVVATVRGGGVRISPHFYNSEEEIERFLSVLP